uniref:Ribosomal protein S5 n=1 Tax=Bubo bubo TaxID=30461 RepID=A0A8C0F162_BUBBB
MTDWETAPAVTETPDIKLFGKWSTDDVQINDISLQVSDVVPHQDYIAVKEKYAKYLPHSAGRYAAKRFRKAQCPIVERLTNSMMMHGRNNGKKLMTVRIVKHAFEIIHLLTGEHQGDGFGWVWMLVRVLGTKGVGLGGSSNSYAIKKKDELERVAKSNR